MVSESNPIEIAKKLAGRSSSVLATSIRAVHAMTGDASSRRYFRVELTDSQRPSAILMLLAHGSGPLVAGEQSNQDDTYVELSDFLKKHAILTPELLSDGRDIGALLIEDVGDRALWQSAFKRPRDEQQTFELYKKAIDVMFSLRAISPDTSSIAFRRWLGFEQYQSEANRFIEFFLPQFKLEQAQQSIILSLISDLCTRLSSQQKVLSHRDFMSWNIHIDSRGDIRILDFQDALLAAPAYDLISLLADRDTSLALGKDLVKSLMQYFADKAKLSPQLFNEQFYTALLQRHLRLCGQFLVLSEKKQNPIYKSWVPGMLHWIGRALKALPEYEEAQRLLVKLIPEIRSGYADPI